MMEGSVNKGANAGADDAGVQKCRWIGVDDANKDAYKPKSHRN